MARKYGIFYLSLKIVMVLNRKLLVSWVQLYKKIEFGPKMTELWVKNTCPYMGA